MSNVRRKILLQVVRGLAVLVSFVLLTHCGNDYVPKPRGFFRIDLPQKEYIRFNDVYPYSFEYPDICRLTPDTNRFSEPYWLDLTYPVFRAKIHLSYKHVHNDLNRYLEDTRSMLMKHIPKANAIREKQYEDAANSVYGVIYQIEGLKAASPIQFYATDSVSNFIRGALYFNAVPNNDSLAPVINFIGDDIQKLISSLKWN